MKLRIIELLARSWEVNESSEIMEKDITLQSTISCPQCGHQKLETMPTDACQFFYECENCHIIMKPKEGDCCVFCTYGNNPCPPIQMRKPGPYSG